MEENLQEQQTAAPKQGMEIPWKRIVVTLALVMVVLGLSGVIHSFEGSVSGSIAVQQLEDSATSYGTSNTVLRAIASVLPIIYFVMVLLLAWVWVPFVKEEFTKNKKV